MQNLKVLFLATRDWRHPGVAGGDINMWECARYLASRGHTVTFLASSFPGAKKLETLVGIQVVRLGGLLSLWLTTFLYYMRKCRGQYDVVVAEGFGGSRIPRLAPLYVKEPIITEWRQVHRELFAAQYPRPLLPLLNFFERATAFVHRNTSLVAYTPEGKEAFAALGFGRESIFVVPVSIRDEWLGYRPDRRITPPTVVWLGKFRRYKCPHHIVLAMPKILKTSPAARLILAGRHDDSRYEQELRALVSRLGLQQNIEFRFDLTEEDKRTLLRSCRVMVLPSSVEGFGIVVLEANSCGVPVVASTGVPESVVSNGRNGLRYSFGDINALAESVIGMLMDRTLRGDLSEKSLAFVQHFSWECVGSQYEEVIRDVIEPVGKLLTASSGGDQ